MDRGPGEELNYAETNPAQAHEGLEVAARYCMRNATGTTRESLPCWHVVP